MDMKFIKWIFLALIVILVAFYWQFYMPVSESDSPVFFEIAPGENFENVIPRLKEKNLIRNETLFEYYAEYSNLDTKVKAGRYRLDPAFSPARLLRFLTDPEHGEMAVVVPEGAGIAKIDEKLESLGLIAKGDFIKSASLQTNELEGFLFPDTYFVFSKNFDPKDLISKMRKNFEKKVVNGLADEFKKSKKTMSEIITMASILEKEVKTKPDYAVVSGILWKRLENEWPLQADATLLYEKEDRTISPTDLQKDSPYNTYTRKGLPASPIGNPGLETIQAALQPVDSPYWYYLTAKDGKVIYAKTNREHEENKSKYL